jgi:hypothetical protein
LIWKQDCDFESHADFVFGITKLHPAVLVFLAHKLTQIKSDSAKLNAFTDAIKTFDYDVKHFSLSGPFFLVNVELGNMEKILVKYNFWVSYLIFS